MPIPALNPDGFLPPGLHPATLAEIRERFGVASPSRMWQFELLRLIVEAAAPYATIKRVLVWGSFASAKLEPNDLDYPIVVSINHIHTIIQVEHRRFLSPIEARMHYGADKKYLVIRDYPLESYADDMDFLRLGRDGSERGIVEISVRGEYTP